MRTPRLLPIVVATIVIAACAAAIAPLWSWYNASFMSLNYSGVIQLQNGNLLHASVNPLEAFTLYFNELDKDGKLLRTIPAPGVSVGGPRSMVEFDGAIYAPGLADPLALARVDLASGNISTLPLPLPIADHDQVFVSEMVVAPDRIWVSGAYFYTVDGQRLRQAVLWSVDAAGTAAILLLPDAEYIDKLSVMPADSTLALVSRYTDSYAVASGFGQAVVRVDADHNVQVVYEVPRADRLLAINDKGYYSVRANGLLYDRIAFFDWQGATTQEWSVNRNLGSGSPELLAHRDDRIMISASSRVIGSTVAVGQTWEHNLYTSSVIVPGYNLAEVRYMGNLTGAGDDKAIVWTERYTVRPYSVTIGEESKVSATHTEIYTIYDLSGKVVKTFHDLPYTRIVGSGSCSNFDCGSEQSPASAGVCHTYDLVPLRDQRFAAGNIHCTGDFAGGHASVSVFKY